MNILWRYGVSAMVAAAPLASVAAETQKVYFNQQGQLTATMSAVAYERRYQVQNGVAQVQDFYYPSLKKYSDPYQVAAAQIRKFVPTLQNGTLTLWYFNGQKKMAGSYKNGKPDGEWTNWYANGRKSAVMPYVNGQSEGLGARFYRNGNKESEIQFKNDKANGTWKQWYPDGSPKTEMSMVNDTPVSIVSRNEQGKLLSELSINNGKRSGIVIDWYESGAKKSEAVYQNDNLIKRTLWDEDGYILED